MDKKKLYTVLKAVFWCVIGAVPSWLYDLYLLGLPRPSRPVRADLRTVVYLHCDVWHPYGHCRCRAAGGDVHGKKEAEIKASPRPSAGGLRVI